MPSWARMRRGARTRPMRPTLRRSMRPSKKPVELSDRFKCSSTMLQCWGCAVWPTELSHELLLSTFEANVGSALVAAQAVASDMRASQRGTILFTSGSWGFTPSGEYCSVGLGKAALYNLGLSLAEELAGDGIHVATITISGRIRSASDYPYDPERLAERYWSIHRQARPDWQADVRC